MKIKFLNPYRVGEVRADQQTSRVCYNTTLNLALTNPKKKSSNGKGVMTIVQPTEEECLFEIEPFEEKHMEPKARLVEDVEQFEL